MNVLMLMSLQGVPTNRIVKNNMEVSWHHDESRIYFEMKAPTNGWVTVGFNKQREMTGAYLLMGNVIDGRANLVEHYTKSHGNYKKISDLGEAPSAQHISGEEMNGETVLRFSLPIKAQNQFTRNLNQGAVYEMTLAYSREDDFQHHSMMRTAIQVKL